MLSWRKVNRPCDRLTLQAPKTCAVVQIGFRQRLHEDSVMIFHLAKLEGEGKTSKVAAKENDKRLGGVANTDFQERLFCI